MRPLDPGSRWLIALLGALTGLTALSIDISLPALPLFTRVLSLTPSQAQLTLSLFLLGYAGGQMFVGPASDRFGRRPVLLAGLAAYALAGFGCALAESGTTLIALRFLQGAAACGVPVLARAMVRDHFHAAKAAQVLSSLTVVLALAPMVAPVLGGQLLAHLDWHAIFWVLGGAGLVLFALVACFLGESLPVRDPAALLPRQLARHVGAFLANRASLAHALVVFFVFGAQFAYISGSPFVLIDVFGVPRERYGYFLAATAACLMVGAAVNRRLLERFAAARLLRVGLWLLVGSGAALAAAALAGAGVAVVFAPLLVFFFGLGLTSPNATAAALEPMRRSAGVASAVLGAFQMVGGALAGWAVSLLYDHTARPKALAVAVLGAGALITHRVLAPAVPRAAAPSAS